MYKIRSSRVAVMFVLLSIGIPAATWAQLPSKDLTPGKTAKVTKEQVCASSFVSPAKELKAGDARDVWDSYAMRPTPGRDLIQLVPSSLGGTNDKQNLWPLAPSTVYGPTQKKALDEKLHSLVCSGSLELKDAQDALKNNWMDAYKKYVTP